jgi:PadR family transcriptional regulator, regulatory protein PadR
MSRKQRRLSAEAARVLGVFVADPERERFGLEMIRLAGIPSGSLYPILHRFEERGLLIASWEDMAIAETERRRQRRTYLLNPRAADRATILLDEWTRDTRAGVRATPKPELT